MYAFLVTIVAHCIFMQRWREILRFFGIWQRKSVDQPIGKFKALAELGAVTNVTA